MMSTWKGHIARNLMINPMDFQMTLTEGLSYIHFKKEEDLNLLLFVKFMEDNRRTYEFNSNNVPDNGIITIK